MLPGQYIFAAGSGLPLLMCVVAGPPLARWLALRLGATLATHYGDYALGDCDARRAGELSALCPLCKMAGCSLKAWQNACLKGRLKALLIISRTSVQQTRLVLEPPASTTSVPSRPNTLCSRASWQRCPSGCLRAFGPSGLQGPLAPRPSEGEAEGRGGRGGRFLRTTVACQASSTGSRPEISCCGCSRPRLHCRQLMGTTITSEGGRGLGAAANG